MHLGTWHTCTTNFLDLLLRSLGEELSLHNDSLLRQTALAENLEEARLGDIDHWHDTLGGNLGLGELLAGAGWDQSPEAIEVHSRAMVRVLGLVEVTHTDFTEEARVVFVEIDTVVMLATRVTATTRVLTVLADTTFTVGHIATGLPSLLQACCHLSP